MAADQEPTPDRSLIATPWLGSPLDVTLDASASSDDVTPT